MYPSIYASIYPSNGPSIPPSMYPSKEPSLISLMESFTLEWKVIADDIEKVFETEAKKTHIEQSLKSFLNYLLECKSEAKITNVKLFQKQKNLFVKGTCVGFRESCIIDFSHDVCNGISLLEDFINHQMLELSPSFDYNSNLSVSFDFDEDNFDFIPDFLSEIIEGISELQKAASNSGEPEPPEVNNEAILTIQRNGANTKFQSQAAFKQHIIKFEGLISLSTEDFSITELSQSDDTITESSYYGTSMSKCGDICVAEKNSIEAIFTFYGLHFNTSIDVCFWDEINCIDGSVTQIFIRKY